MKPWVKGGLIGFIVGFVGLWIILFIIGSDAGGYKCMTFDGLGYCSIWQFIISPVNWGFVFLFSWIAFFGGVVDAKKIKKIIHKSKDDRLIPLKITSTIMLTVIVVFAAISWITMQNRIEVMIYTITFYGFTLLVSWLVGRYKYKR